MALPMHLPRLALLALALLLLIAGALVPAQAQAPAAPAASAAATAAPEPKPDDSQAQRSKTQPGNNAPFWRAVRESGHQAGISNLPGAEKGVLVQPFVQYPGVRFNNAGEAWRQVRNRWILPYGGALIVISLLAVGLFYWRKGPLGEDHGTGGRRIERFTPFERAAHWCNAIAFSVLAISGLVMAFGKFVLLPVIGSTLFGGLTYLLKTAHNFAGPLFAVSLLIVILTFIRDNLPNGSDLRWILSGGGMFGGSAETPSHRFNGGEKAVFWVGVLVLGVTAVGSGLVLDKVLPGLDYLRTDMQVAHMIHAVATMLMMALFIGHIYMGTIGTRGAWRGMREGYVSEGWAREHHALWAADIEAGKIPAQRSKEAQAAPLAGPMRTT